jgi:hypothetical protein
VGLGGGVHVETGEQFVEVIRAAGISRRNWVRFLNQGRPLNITEGLLVAQSGFNRRLQIVYVRGGMGTILRSESL